MTKRKIILDCDPGQDDAVAILLALASPDEIDLLGITTVAGNVPLSLTSTNALRICEVAKRTDVEVYAGCSRPMLRRLMTAEWVHGSTGIDGSNLPDPTMALQPGHAVDYIFETCLAAEDASVTICPIGPMTNVALAIIKAPEILPKIAEVVFMGGTVFNPGNTSPSAEFNILVDPHAAHVVVHAGVKLTMLGLDVTHKALTTAERHKRLSAIDTSVGRCVAGMLDFYNRFDMKRYGMEGGPLHDPCVIAYLIDPTMFQGRQATLDIEIVSELTMGRTAVDWWNITDAPSNAYVIDEIDHERFFALLTERLARL